MSMVGASFERLTVAARGLEPLFGRLVFLLDLGIRLVLLLNLGIVSSDSFAFPF